MRRRLFGFPAGTGLVLALLAGAAANPQPAPAVVEVLAAHEAAGAPASNPFDRPLWVDRDSQARYAADGLRKSRPRDAGRLDKIAKQPQAVWVGDWVPTADVRSTVRHYVRKAADAKRFPVFVAYSIPLRDCGGYSAGGAASPAAYRDWILAFAKGIGDHRAAVVLEPDALAGMDCLSDTKREKRLDLLRFAVTRFGEHERTSVYIDAGHSAWHSAGTMAKRLRKAGIGNARGFSLNVSNFNRTSEQIGYGHKIGHKLGRRTPFVIDTSRNGNGPTKDRQWCNPAGRALGKRPTANVDKRDVDALLWIKRPGESDGSCNGAPPAGQFWTDYALGLVERASWA